MFEITLPAAGITINWLSVILIGASIGLISGLFGVGGGFLLTPLLNVVLGIPYNLAVGSSLGQMVFTALSGLLRHLRHKNADLKLASFFIAGSFLGVLGGVRALGSLKSDATYQIRGHLFSRMDLIMSILYFIFLLAMGSYILYESFKNRSSDSEPESGAGAFVRSISLRPKLAFISIQNRRISIWPLVFTGCLVGFLSGLLGIGGGFILMPVLMYVVGLPTRIAVGTSLLQTFAAAVFGSFSHFLKGNVDITLILLLLGGSIIGAQFGALLTMRLDSVSIRKYFGFFVLAAAAMVASKFL